MLFILRQSASVLAGNAHMQSRVCARGQCPACGDCAFGLVRHGKATGRNPPSALTLASGLEVYLLAIFCRSCLRVLICFGSNFVRTSSSTECHPSRKFPGARCRADLERRRPRVGRRSELPHAGVPDRQCVIERTVESWLRLHVGSAVDADVGLLVLF